MLTIFHERLEARLFPPGVWFHLSHLGHKFQVLCFLMSVPNRVWDSMGSPCLTLLAHTVLVVARADLHLQPCVCAWLVPRQFSKQPRSVGTWFPIDPTWPAEDPFSCDNLPTI